MRIAFISTILGYPWGGADTLWTHAAEAASVRNDVLLLGVSPAVAGHPRLQALAARGAQIVIREPGNPALSLLDRVRRKLGLGLTPDTLLIAALRKFHPDTVIFSQGGTYDLLLLPRLAAWLREHRVDYRVIANWQQEHPHLEPAELDVIRPAFSAAGSLNFVSTRNLEITRRHLGLPLPNARVIQNPLRWQPADTSPWPAGAVARLATVSRLDEGKGIHLLLEALARLPAGLPEWQLNIHGQGPHETVLRAIAAQPALRDRVHFRGYVKDLRSIWAGNQLMVSPAIDDGVPMTIPEAMLCQRPVLATRVGGAEDWLRDGETGFLCAPADATALGAALARALSHHAAWSTMGQAAQAFAQARYRADDYLQLITPC